MYLSARQDYVRNESGVNFLTWYYCGYHQVVLALFKEIKGNSLWVADKRHV
jgi:hypothetical protein